MNLIVQNPALPSRAGKTRIEFGNPATEPKRVGDVVSLPLINNATFYPLSDGKQFLFRIPRIDEGYRRADDRLYFGGTDEEPFFVRLDPVIFGTYDRHGEKRFFESLVPTNIQRICRAFEVKWKRQGDIFAAPLPIPWRTAQQMAVFQQMRTMDDEVGQVALLSAKKTSVFDTRHLLTGGGVRTHLLGMSNVSLAEGFVEAPDHEELKLPGVNVLDQTAHLFDPKNAD